MVDAIEEEVPHARQCCSDACVLGYVSMSEEVNINPSAPELNAQCTVQNTRT
jgi:hypothetical protein